MKQIKTRPATRDIKVLDKAANLSSRMKNAAVKSKSAAEAASHEAEQTQDAGHASPTAYASDTAISSAKTTTEKATQTLRKNPVKQASANMEKARQNVQELRRQVGNIKDAVKPSAQHTPQKEMVKRAKNARQTPTRARKTAEKTVKSTAKSTPKAAKSTAQTVKSTAKGTVKTAQKTIKTAEHGGKVAVKTAQHTAKAAKATAQATVRAAKMAAHMARVAAKAAVTAAKATAKIVAAMVKAIIAATKALIAAIAAGGWVAVLVILVICLIGLLVGSIFGIFFSGEESGNGRTMPDAVQQLTTEFYQQIEEIKADNPHDVALVEAMAINWREVLAVYAVKVNTDPENGMDVATLDDTKVALLRGVLDDMVDLSYTVSTETRERIVMDEDGEETTEEVEVVILTITMTQQTADEAAAQYLFNQTQQDQLHELLNPEYADLWAALFGGYAAGGGDILIGNPGKVPLGIFAWPLEGAYPVNSPYGWRPDPFDPSKTEYHGGIDIACPEGTPILAAADGTVVVANSTDSWGGSYGYYVKIQHDGTNATLYAHCSQIAVTGGQQVAKGQVIGYVGTSGSSTGFHLHFEVFENGQRTDPQAFFGE